MCLANGISQGFAQYSKFNTLAVFGLTKPQFSAGAIQEQERLEWQPHSQEGQH
jgi:hypothetical protein